MDRHETAARKLEEADMGAFAATKETRIERHAAILREHFHEPGRCGECRSGGAHKEMRTCTDRGETIFESVRCKEWGLRFPIACSCPRFEAKPDKYEELAREMCGKLIELDLLSGSPQTDWATRKLFADFLRERMTVKEVT